MTRMLLPMVPLVLAFECAVAGEQPLHVTVQQLLATPEKFAGKRVDVTGWYLAINEDSQLYTSKDASRGDLEDSIWLEPDIWDPRYHPHRPPGVSDSRRVENRTVRVIGTFHFQPQPDRGRSVPYERRFQGFGSYSLNKRAIDHITYIQPVH
jgi:hypothetical protein